MAAYAEGLNILQQRQRRQAARAPTMPRRRRCAIPSSTSTRSNLPRDRRGLAPRQRHRLVAARPDRRRAARRTRSSPPTAAASRTPARAAGRSQAAIDEAVPAPVLSAALYERFTSRGEADFADQVLSAMRHEFGGHVEKPAEGTPSEADRPRAPTPPRSDALVVFGFTGDLAHKKIFPALYAMVKKRRARRCRSSASRRPASSTDAGARSACATASSTQAAIDDAAALRPAALAAALRQRRLPATPATFDALKAALGRRAAAGALPGDSAGAVRDRDPRPRRRRASRGTPASSSKSRSAATSPRRSSSTRSRTRSSRSRRSSASTTTSARRRS